jgi:predicted RNase H-like nuclease
VFPAPVRTVVDAATWAEANARGRAADGRGVARQTFGLLAKIREVDGLLSPALQDRVVEVHPEVAFALLAGGPLAAPKRVAAGLAVRRDLVAAAFGAPPPPVRGAAADDVLDACAVLWSAGRVARGEHVVMGDGAVDERGLRMEILA